ncbi:MAG TPA: class I SAM-dependent methyltransferase [Gaiellales bacterium]
MAGKMQPDRPAGTAGRGFGVTEIVAAAANPATALDLGCGSGRVTIALALAGAAATGVDTHAGRLADARDGAERAGVDATFVAADMNATLPFADAAFAAVTSRLALMIARDPVATLREAARVLRPGGVVVTAVWARIDQNPWFGEPRAAVAAALGPERAAFANAFDRLGDADELVDLHRRAGFAGVEGRVVRDELHAPDAAAHWAYLTATIGHFSRLAAALSPDEQRSLHAELADRLAPLRRDGELRLGRAMVLVNARR